MRRGLFSERGVTMFEVALMLTVTMAIVAALAPSMTATLRDARATRAASDMADIRAAILAFQANTLYTNFTQDGDIAGAPMELLVSDGDIPQAGTSSDWTAYAGSTLETGFLEQHLVTNSFNGGASYPTGGANPWRGAYLNAPVNPDPWGNRYAVNVGSMGAGTDDVVVFSAGPDEAVDTPSIGNPIVAAGDDLILLVES